jgi:CelD/BcsL family acetyltransferase involved in cellulose biosynthesis
MKAADSHAFAETRMSGARVESGLLQDVGLFFRAYQGLQGLEQLAPEWTALVESLNGAGFNYFPEWYRAYVSSRRSDPNCVWFIAAYRDRELAAVFPLQLQTHRVRFLQPRFLGTIEDDQLQLSDFVFAQIESNAGLLNALVRWLRAQRTFRWDELRLLRVRDDAALAYAARAGLPRATAALLYDRSAFFDTRGSYDQATRAISSKFKSNLRRRSRLAEESAPLRFQSCRGSGELKDAFDRFLEIESSGWKGSAGTSSAIRCRPEMLAFYEGLVREFGARDACVINLLWHGEQAIAAQFCLQIGRTLNILKVGYRDDRSLIAPGILLQERIIQHACADRDIDVLSLVNDPSWARSFKPLSVGVWSYFAPNWTAIGLLAHLGLLVKRWWGARTRKHETPA